MQYHENDGPNCNFQGCDLVRHSFSRCCIFQSLFFCGPSFSGPANSAPPFRPEFYLINRICSRPSTNNRSIAPRERRGARPSDRVQINDLFSRPGRLVTADQQACSYASRSLIALSVTTSSRRGVGSGFTSFATWPYLYRLTNARIV